MTALKATYERLLAELLFARELSGGALAEDEESRYVEELDQCWWSLTDAEQRAIEEAMAGNVEPEAPRDLKEEDVTVAKGEHRLPRQPSQQAA